MELTETIDKLIEAKYKLPNLLKIKDLDELEKIEEDFASQIYDLPAFGLYYINGIGTYNGNQFENISKVLDEDRSFNYGYIAGLLNLYVYCVKTKIFTIYKDNNINEKDSKWFLPNLKELDNEGLLEELLTFEQSILDCYLNNDYHKFLMLSNSNIHKFSISNGDIEYPKNYHIGKMVGLYSAIGAMCSNVEYKQIIGSEEEYENEEDYQVEPTYVLKKQLI